MKKLSKIFTTLLAIIISVSCFAAVGCGGGDGSKDGELTIRFYEGGFGRDWLVTALEDFVAEKEAQGKTISYKLVPDATITDSAQNLLRAGTNLPDIMMTQGNDWASFVTNGWLEPLTTTYETEVEKLDGSKIKVKDFLIDELERYPYQHRLAGQGDSQPWVMPWSLLETSIIYNHSLLTKTKHTQTVAGEWNEGETWTDAPTTMLELKYLCDDINSSVNQTIYGKTVAPLSWSGAGINYFENIIYVLWAQKQGVETSLIANEGSYYDFWNFESSNVWKQTGIQNAIDEWRNIIVDVDNNTWKNSIVEPEQKAFLDSARIFCKQEAVMLLGGSFFENETKPFFEGTDGYESFEFRMMNIPLASGTVQTNDEGKPATINFCSCDDIMFVPAEATNKELAKEFLAYLCNERYLLDFSLETGCLRPFDYDPVELTKDDTSVVWSDFFFSCYNMKMNADFNIFTYPLKAAKENKVSLFYTYYKPDLFQRAGVSSAMLMLKQLDGKTLMVDGSPTYDSIYKRADADWKDMKEALGL